MDPVSPIATSLVSGVSPALTHKAAPASAGAGFMDALGEALAKADGAQVKSEKIAQAYQMGAEGVTLESSMVAMQEANVSLQFLVQVRNKLVSAYHDIMNMPV